MITPILLLFQLLAAPPDDLTRKITALDAEVFDAYNKCDLAKFASFLAEDLEFYHDQGGLSVGRQATVEAVKNNICGKVHRDLVPGTLAVYPLKATARLKPGFTCSATQRVQRRPASAATAAALPVSLTFGGTKMAHGGSRE